MSRKPGEIIKHKLTGEKLLVLKQGNTQIECRTEDLRAIYFSEEELVELAE